MTEAEAGLRQPRVAKIGWGLLMLVSALYILNGIGWFFAGPGSVVDDLAERLGTTAGDLGGSFPDAVFGEEREARWVAIYLTSIGAMSLIAALNGYRKGTRWAWYVTWVLVATIAAVFANGIADGELGFFVIGVGVLLVIAIAGQLMAGRRPTA